MTATEPKKRPSSGARRFGYFVAFLVNAAMLYAANRWPGWDALPFLTEDTARVMPMVNASIVVGLGANVVYLVHDPRWLRALGDLVTTAFGIAAMVRIWEVFPFSFSGGFDWALVVRVLLVLGIAGSAIGMVTNVVALVREATWHSPRHLQHH
jgi:hypothetical protein